MFIYYDQLVQQGYISTEYRTRIQNVY
jgi:hypothetical protein